MEKEAVKFLFEHQVKNLLAMGYPEMAGLSEHAFIDKVSPLRDKLSELSDIKNITLPFVIVVKSSLITPEQVMPLVEVNGKKGKVDMNPVGSDYFSALDFVTIPEHDVYLLSDIDTGQDTLNIAPIHALTMIEEKQRTPLTIDEGVALMVQYPEVILSQNAFSMLASRARDKKVPAMWISYGNPRLGWCWEGNPHTWLGSASAAKRVG